MALPLLLALALAAPIDRPLGVGTPGTFRALLLEQPLTDARPPSSPKLELRWTIANDWSVPTTLGRDGRTVSLRSDEQCDAWTLKLRVPWARAGALARLDTAVELVAREHWGGWTDGLVEGWHQLAGYGNFDREKFPRDALAVWLRDPQGRSVVALDRARFGLGDVVVRQQLALASDGDAALSLRGDLALPTGSLEALSGSGRATAGLALLGALPLRPWLTGHAQLAAALAPRLPSDFPLQPRRVQASFDASLVAHRGRWAFLAEDRLVSPLFEAGWQPVVARPDDALSTAAFGVLRWNNQLSFGLRWGALTAWLSEDFTPGHVETTGADWFYDSNAPDLVLGLDAAW